MQPHKYAGSNKRLRTIFENDFKPIYLRGKAQRTFEQYEHTLKSFEQFLERQAVLADLNDKTVSNWLAWLKEQPFRGQKRSPSTVNGRREFLMCFTGWLHRRGFIRVMPEVQSLDVPEVIPDAWTLDELQRLLTGAADLRGWVKKEIPANYFWQAWLLLAWDTGERTGAMLALRGEWLTGVMLSVPAAVRKGKKPATYTLKPATVSMLDQSGLRQRELIFPVSFPTYRKWFTEILAAAKLPDGSRSLNQKLRRSFATHLEKQGGDATEALLHTSRAVTKSAYLDPSIIQRPSPNLLLPDLGVGGSA